MGTYSWRMYNNLNASKPSVTGADSPTGAAWKKGRGKSCVPSHSQWYDVPVIDLVTSQVCSSLAVCGVAIEGGRMQVHSGGELD